MLSWLFEITARFRNLFFGARLDSQLDEELDQHIAMLTEDYLKRGFPPEAARREAVLKVGRRDVLKETHRDARALRAIDDFVRDVRHSARLLRRNPLFTLLAAASLAIGIGADTTVFTAANALLFRSPAGVKDPDRLVDISRTKRGQFGVYQLSYPDFLEIRRRTTTLDDVFLYEPMTRPMSLSGADGSETVFGVTVSLNYFATLGVAARAGQLFPLGGDQDSRVNPFVVLSYAFWQRRFHGDPGIIGKTVQINGDHLQVTGVAAEGFQGVSIVSPDIFVPIGSTAADSMRFSRRGAGWAMMGGRLKPGVSIAAAAAEMNAIGVALAKDYSGDAESGLRLTAQSMIPGNLVVAVMGIFALLLAFVSLVLVIACANMAGVLLSRAAARRRELAVRLAIGAGRARLVRQLLTEAVLVFLLGAAAGLVVSRGLTAAVVSRIPTTDVPINLCMNLDARVVVFTLGLSLLSAVLCGLIPALRSSRADLVSDLKNEGQASTHRGRLQNTFVIAQVALSTILVVGALLFWGALQRVRSVDFGYDPKDVDLVAINLRPGGPAIVPESSFIREVMERVRALPGVRESSVAGLTPLEAGRLTLDLRRPEEGSPAPRLPDPSIRVSWNSVEPGYFKTMRIALLAGRDFAPTDTFGSQAVAIVGEDAAREFWPGEDAIGKVLPAKVGDPGGNALVIGVARDIKAVSGPRISPPTIYRPLSQRPFPFVTIVVRRAAGTPLIGQIHAIVFSLNPNVPLLSSQTLEQGIANATAPQRNAALVTGGLGLVGLVLASIGVYAVTAYAVTRRTREIGIRVALGAERARVITLVLREGMSLVGIGCGIGLLLSYIASRLAAASPLNVPPNNLWVFAGAAALFAVVGFVACLTPVTRATRIDAASALRHD
jgi:predicted permease